MSQSRNTASPATAGDGPWPGDALLERPLSARSILASLLLGMHPPRLDVARLVRWGGRFGVAPGTARVALSRMVERGELTLRDGVYELSGRVRERQRDQEWALAPALVEPWPGTWRIGVVAAGGRGPRDRAALRHAMRVLHHVEVREGVWVRPDNLVASRLPARAAAVVDGQCSWWHGRPDDVEPVVEAFLIDEWGRRARVLRDRLAEASVAVRDGATDELAGAFHVGAAALVHVRADPLLPAALLPPGWPGPALRSAYRAYRADFGAAVARFLRDG